MARPVLHGAPNRAMARPVHRTAAPPQRAMARSVLPGAPNRAMARLWLWLR